ncbi:MAG: glycosyltransferase family 2 protein [Casimicrobiaceae bacterium]
MVRNEADVIEASVRHNLSVLDGIAIIDHGSIDGTSEILADLAREGLPLRVLHDRLPGFFQAERLTTLAREMFARERADFVFPIDADEFVKVASRERLERALAGIPGGDHAVVGWLTYVPERFDGEIGPSHLRWRLALERHRSTKCVIGSGFLARTSQYLISGSHLVDDLASPNPPGHMRLAAEDVALAHCPVRSRSQLEGKIIIGYAAHLATKPTNDQQAFHWRDLYDELRAGRELDTGRLRDIACNYGLPRHIWQPSASIELVEDPLHPSFELRYPRQSSPDALRLLMQFMETLLRQ